MKSLHVAVQNPALRKVAISAALLVLTYLVGVAGYIHFENWNFDDASFMTIITMGTVGYGETRPLSPAGRWFTQGLILVGMGVILYGVSNLTAFIIEGELQALIRRSRMDKKIEHLKGHYIVCGAGRTGGHIVDELVASNRKVVIVEQRGDHLAQCTERHPGLLTLEGDATQDRTLEKAGILRAAGLVAALPTDKDNLYVVLTARTLNPALRIIAKADEEEARDKLLRAGADSAVCPSSIGGMRMASEMARPTVVNFLDAMLRGKDASLRVEEVALPEDSPLAGKTLGDSQIAQKTGLLVVALRPRGEDFQFNPPASRRLGDGDTLIVIGDIRHVEILRKLAEG
jgi:voltage-gated potassium channel